MRITYIRSTLVVGGTAVKLRVAVRGTAVAPSLVCTAVGTVGLTKKAKILDFVTRVKQKQEM